MSTRLALAAPLLAGGGFIRNAIRAAFDLRPDRPVDAVQARMELALTTETHPGRRAAIALARHNHPEQP